MNDRNRYSVEYNISYPVNYGLNKKCTSPTCNPDNDFDFDDRNNRFMDVTLKRSFHGIVALGALKVFLGPLSIPLSLGVSFYARTDKNMDYRADTLEDAQTRTDPTFKSYWRTFTVPTYYASKAVAAVADTIGYTARAFTGLESTGRKYQFVNLVHTTFDKVDGIALSKEARVRAKANQYPLKTNFPY
tara:strand:+ start:204 stop:767 length:564 start_codon:yes stop_codon:yes gene_type:complete